MVLVDTSIWIDHLRRGDSALISLLNGGQVYMHPFVQGELACGNLANRIEVLILLSDLPRIAIASDKEVLFFIERQSLMGQGIGYIDAHLLAAVKLSGNATLWTRDKRLDEIARRLGFSFENR